MGTAMEYSPGLRVVLGKGFQAAVKTPFTVMALGLAVVLGALIGCATRQINFTTTQAPAIRERAETHFQRAFYLKPAETNRATAPARQLAPLLIIEAPDTNALAELPANRARPQIYYQSGHTTGNGKPHEQMTFWWTYPNDLHRSRGGSAAQGVRITLNSAGRPVIWETLVDTSGAQVIHVAQSLEAQAVREFAAPLKGRRFAIERPLTDAPKVVVARVIEDGPETMGPIVYLQSGTHDLTTIICRCMAAQARELAGQQEYDLVPALNASRTASQLGGIERRLRLPENF